MHAIVFETKAVDRTKTNCILEARLVNFVADHWSMQLHSADIPLFQSIIIIDMSQSLTSYYRQSIEVNRS